MEIKELSKEDLDLLEKCKYVGGYPFHPDHSGDKEYG